MNGDTGRLVSLIFWKTLSLVGLIFSPKQEAQLSACVRKSKRAVYFRRKGLKCSQKLREGARVKNLVG